MKAYKTSQGKWQVNYSERGKQRTIHLGRDFTSGSADRVATIVTDILSCRKRGDAVPLEILRRVENLPERVRNSFERHGLIGGVSSWTLADLLEKFRETKSHFKKTTQDFYRNFGNHLAAFFGSDCRLSAIGKLDCERFKNQHLGKLAACTTSRGLRACRTIFKYAVDAGWLENNPFKKVSSRVDVNLVRQSYVDNATIYKVMEYCRDDYDRLLLALARFGGLRIPSEAGHLRYCDFDLVNNVIRIHQDTKTGAREVPLFGEIREIFDRIVVNLGKISVPADSPGENYSADSQALVFGKLGNRGTIHNRILAVIRASGVPVWLKLFVNLRSSCITDLVGRGYSEKTLDAIFGNSARVRNLHYVQFLKDKEYSKVLEDAERLRRLSVENVVKKDTEFDIESLDEGELLRLRDWLLKRYGTGKQAG